MSWYAPSCPPMRERAAVEALSKHCEAFSPIEYVMRRTNLRAPTAKKIAIPARYSPATCSRAIPTGTRSAASKSPAR